MANKDTGKRPGEFGGVPGLYGNVDEPARAKLQGIAGVLTPNQERMSLMQTNESCEDSLPSHGSGGERVK